LAKRDVSIVSDIPGTTRDIVEAHVDIKGLPVIFADTAGLRETKDEIESIGVDRARKAIEKAALNIHLIDISDLEDFTLLQKNISKNDLVVVNKIDKTETAIEKYLSISVKKELNIDRLLDELYNRLIHFNIPDSSLLTARERHNEHLKQTIYYLEQALINEDLVLAAEDMRLAKREFEEICGLVDVEEILGKIFSSFCIGK
jgi:tRNA modification GTPase